MIMFHNDDDCGDFKVKQILSVFLEYLVEQSLLVQHEYKRPPNCCSNQSTKEKNSLVKSDDKINISLIQWLVANLPGLVSSSHLSRS